MRTWMLTVAGLTALSLSLGLGLSACGNEGGGGVCLHDFGPAIECFADWNQSGCEENGWDWISGQTCSELGYSSLCGGQSYTLPGTCPL